MTNTHTDDTFAGVTSPDVAPGETPKAARTRRKTEANRARRAATTPKPKAAPKPKADAAPAADDTPRGPGRPVGSGTKRAKREASVTATLALVGGLVSMWDQTDGDIIVSGASDVGEAFAKLAETNPKVAKALDALTEGAGWGEVALAVSGIVIPITLHHVAKRRAVPAGRPVDSFGPVPVPQPEPDPDYADQPWMMPFQAQPQG